MWYLIVSIPDLCTLTYFVCLLGWWGPDALAVCWAYQALPVGFLLLRYSVLLLLSPYLLFTSLLYLDLYVLGDNALLS